jgi:hypothetical protein
VTAVIGTNPFQNSRRLQFLDLPFNIFVNNSNLLGQFICRDFIIFRDGGENFLPSF